MHDGWTMSLRHARCRSDDRLIPAGIGRIYLYDHESDTPLRDQLEDLISEGKVVVHRFQGRHRRFAGGTSLSFQKTAQVSHWVGPDLAGFRCSIR